MAISNRRKISVGIAGVLAIVGSFFIWRQKTKQEPQPPAEKAITGNDSQASAADPQHQVNYLIGIGNRMMDNGDYVSARSYYEDALKLDPSNAAARARMKSADRATAPAQ